MARSKWSVSNEAWRNNIAANKQRYADEGYDISWVPKKEEDAVTISLCETIFKIEDLSREKIYVDISDCVLQTEDDVLDVINYEYSKRSFIFSQKPVFIPVRMFLRISQLISYQPYDEL